MQAHCHQTTSQPKNDLPACVIISSKALCAGGDAFNHPFLYLLLRIHVCKCWFHCYHMTISALFSLSPVKDPCLQVLISLSLIGNNHILFSISCSASMSVAFMHTHCHWTTSESREIWPNSQRPITIMQNISLRTTGPSPLGNKSLTTGCTDTGPRFQETSQPKDSRPHLYRPIAIRQQVSLRKSGRTHTGPSPFGNKTV